MVDLTLKFDDITFDLKKISESRMLSQYSQSTLFKLLLGAITDEVQELSDALTDLIKYRTIAYGRGKVLDVIGRIVGIDRTTLNYDTSYWFAPETDGVQPDNGHWWVKNAPQATTEEMDDETYKKWIWMKILKNHNKFSSKPEIENQIYGGLGEKVAIQRTGMITQDLYVTTSISTTNKGLLSYVVDTTLTDNQFKFAYPAATSIENVIEH